MKSPLRIARSPYRLARRAAAKIRRELSMALRRRRDLSRPTYAVSLPPVAELHSYFPALPIAALRPHADWIAGLSAQYVAGRFDLLGSGWTAIRYGIKCLGLEGHIYPPENAFTIDAAGEWLAKRLTPNNVSESRRCWKLLDADYTPIDWQRDFISGYRWSEKTWYKSIAYGKLPGVDVKVPWELARMQHLPQLAWAYALANAGEPDFPPPETYARAFRNQVLDFIATNPPRFGVNWKCAMDVAIRVSNWLAAYDLFKKYGASFDSEWEAIFRRSVWEHADHIAQNLEWSDTFRSNHYLADIAGLLFCAAYLPRSEQSDQWLMLAVTEMNREILLQFGEDGANFEGSTAYHRLSAEMAVYSVALMMALPQNKSPEKPGRRFSLNLLAIPGAEARSPCPEKIFERLNRMARFVTGIARPDGAIPQIGDNDSGRFLKLQPAVTQETPGIWTENAADCRHLVAAISGLFDDEEYHSFAGGDWFEYDIIRRIADTAPAVFYGDFPPVAEKTSYRANWESAPNSHYASEWKFPGADLRRDLQLNAFADFGLYVWRSPRLYLSVRCGKIGQNGNGGHSHNDQLAIELWVDGRPVVVDPGTYIYTPLPDQRNAYRSVRAHHAPYVEGREPGDLTLGLFQIGDTAGARCQEPGLYGFAGTHQGYGSQVMRIIKIEPNIIRVSDYAQSLELAEPQPDKLPYSDGYGKRRTGASA